MSTQLPIHRVTVHPDGARIHRRGSAQASEGRITLTALPLSLIPSSLRVQVEAPSKLLHVDLQLDLGLTDRQDPSELEVALHQAQQALQLLKTEHAALRDTRGPLASLTPALTEAAPPPSPAQLERWVSFDEALSAWAADLDARLRANRVAQQRQIEVVEGLEAQLQAQSSEAYWRAWAPTRRVVLVVEAAHAVEISISYRVASASWTPTYVLEADEQLHAGEFIMRAILKQASGEDWSDVEMTLCTTPSTRTTSLPTLPSLRLGTRQPAQRTGWRPLPSGLDELFPEELTPPGPKPSPPPAAAPSSVVLPCPAPQAPHPASLGSAGLPSAGLPSAGPPVQAKRLARARGSLHKAPPGVERAPTPTRAEELLNHSNLRLGDWASPHRGQLFSLSPQQLLSEHELPSEALTRWATLHQRLAHRTQQLQSGLSTEIQAHFEVQGQVSVPSTGRAHSVAVLSESATLTPRWVTVPREDTRVFRKVEASLSRERPLLPGPLDIIVGGNLELSTHWGGARGEGSVELDLGADNQIKLVRNVRYHEENAGLFGGSRRLRTEIEVQVASSLSRPVQVEVYERVPVADSAGPRVELIGSTPQALEYTGPSTGPALKGGRVQVLKLPPGGEGVARLAYTVTLGAKEELTGGDRRG